MRLFVSIAALAMVAAACTSTEPATTIPPGDSSADTAEIYAAALRQLVVDDNTFGGGGNPFSELLVQASFDSAAGTATPGAQGLARPLSDAERAAIEAALTPIAPMRWIDDVAEWRTDDLMPVVEGSAILGVGPIAFDDQGALVPMSMWCGGLCGTWFTYRMVDTDQGWVVSGIEGPIAVS
jgi:hypothetical protein